MEHVIIWGTIALLWAAHIYKIVVLRQWQQLGKKVEREAMPAEKEVPHYFIKSKCEDCNTPSKRLAAFRDGYDRLTGVDTHSYLYDCDDLSCTIKQERVGRAEVAERNRQAVQQESAANGIDFSRVEKARSKHFCTLYDFCQAVGISPAEYCHYRAGRKAVPKDLWDRLVQLLKLEGGGV